MLTMHSMLLSDATYSSSLPLETYRRDRSENLFQARTGTQWQLVPPRHLTRGGSTATMENCCGAVPLSLRILSQLQAALAPMTQALSAFSQRCWTQQITVIPATAHL